MTCVFLCDLLTRETRLPRPRGDVAWLPTYFEDGYTAYIEKEIEVCEGVRTLRLDVRSGSVLRGATPTSPYSIIISHSL